MLTFHYEASSKDGRPVRGTLRAESALDALRKIEGQGLRPLRVDGRRARGPKVRAKAGLLSPPIRRWHLILFTRELLTVYRSGINILAGLEILAKEAMSERLRTVILDVRGAVEAGGSLSEAMGRHPKVFSEFYRGAVMAGEKSGSLEDVLVQILRYMEEQEKTSNEIRSAIRYPAFVLAALMVAVTVMFVFVFPRLKPLFARFGDDLPLPTKILVSSDVLVRTNGFLLLAGAGLVAAGLVVASRLAPARRRIDAALLHVPLVGPVLRGVYTARLAATLSMLQRSGMPLLQALDVAARVVRSPSFSAEMTAARRAVAEGSSLGDALAERPLVPPLFAQLASLGEKTGRLDDLLAHVAEHYRIEVRERLTRLIATIEPILTATLAGFILFLALAIFLPYWNMIKAFRR